MKKVKPICFGHNEILYIIIVGEKSLAFDFKKNSFTPFATMNYHIANTNDLKPIVVNDHELFVFQSSKWSSKSSF